MIEYLPLVLTGLGIMVSIFYYAMVLRNTSRARQIEMLHRLHDSKYDVEGLEHFFMLMTHDWEDFDDWYKQYGQDQRIKSIMESQMSYLEGLGVLVKKEVIDLDTVYDIMGRRIIQYWLKYETVVKGLRSAVGFGPGPDYCTFFEYLANEMIRIRKQRGSPFPLHYLHKTSTLHDELSNP